MANMELIETKTVGSGGASNIEFTGLGSYSSLYTDLYLVCSLRSDAAFTADNLLIQFNGSSSNFTAKNIYGTGSGTPISQSFTTGEVAGFNAANTTANTFSNTTIYIPNFSSSNYKSISTDSSVENNAARGDDSLYATLWSNTAAITSIKLVSAVAANFVQNSTVSLYGISAVPSSPKATGGIVSQDATYWYHMFPFSSTFTPTVALSADVLCIAGGGGGGSGGGGAGGLLAFTSQSLTTTGYTVTIGSGGAGASTGVAASNGGDSQFGSLTLVKGGGRGSYPTSNVAGSQGSGGGGAAYSGSTYQAAGTATSGQGNDGGAGPTGGGYYASAGGGGAGAVGGNGNNSVGAGVGGIGSSTYSSWGLATFTGQIVGGTAYFAGGGGGGADTNPAAGGYGGGGAGSNSTSTSGLINTGGGGGGSSNGPTFGRGGSGLVIVRYAK